MTAIRIFVVVPVLVLLLALLSLSSKGAEQSEVDETRFVRQSDVQCLVKADQQRVACQRHQLGGAI